MHKPTRRRSWSRLFLWSHVLGTIGFYLVLWLRTRPGKDDRVKDPGSLHLASLIQEPLVSIIVPARNEEQNIRRCVTSLLEQDYANYEVIVVDDGSTDETGRILDELSASHPNGERLHVLRLRDELPQGWAGKPHALHCGVQEARGDWLLFTDADTWHAPAALRSALTQARAEQADLFTLGSTQILPTFWEKVLMPLAFLGVGMLYPPRLVNDPRSPVAVANGQYILIRRAVYEAIGGYARPDLRGTLLDDRDLARAIKERGFKLRFVDGRGLVSVRMYHSFDEIWRGWRKNAYLGNRGGLPFFALQLIGLPMVCIVPFLLPLLALFSRRSKSSENRASSLRARQSRRPYGDQERRGQGERRTEIGATEVGVATTLELLPLLAYRHWVDREMNLPWYYAFTHPLAAAVFTGILAQSSWRVITKAGVDWRGRQYHTRENGG